MKKLIVSLVAALSLLFGGIAIGDSLNGTWNGLAVVKVLSGGKTITDEAPAVIMNDKTYVPLTMLRKLGIEVTWNPFDYSVVVEKPLTNDDIARISRSVGLVYVFKDGKQLGRGSGFVIESNGQKYLISNCHVGCIGDELHVTLDGKSYVLKGSSFANETTDVFGVKIDTDVPGLKYSLQMPIQDEPVVAVGFPRGIYAVTKGKITSTSYAPGTIMFDAVIDNGSSGGILIRSDGDMIGVTFRNHPGGQMVMSDALPMQYVQDELARLK